MEPQNPNSKKKIWLIVGVLLVLLLIVGGYYLYQAKNKNMNNPNVEMAPMTYEKAYEYISAYAKSRKIPIEEVFDIKTDNKFRGSVYNVEFEYNPENQILIARGYVFGTNLATKGETEPLGYERKDLWDALLEIQNNPQGETAKKILPGENLDFLNRKFEIDPSIKEIQSDQLYRINIRTDFPNSHLSSEEFVKEIKSLSDFSYLWDKSYFSKVIDYCNLISIPQQAKFYINSYAKSKNIPNISFQENVGGFSTTLNDLVFNFNKESGDLTITEKISKISDINKEFNYYNLKIKQDLSWYWRAFLSLGNDQIMLSIEIGEYNQSDKEVIETINHCINSLNQWRKELQK